MWFVIAFVVAFVAMAALMPKPKIENARASKLGDFNFPRASYGDPVPLVYGTVKQRSPIVIWYGALRTVNITERVASGMTWYGKTKYKNVVVGHRYHIGLNMLLGIGPGVRLRRIWAGKDVAWTGNLQNQSNFNINQPNLFGGDDQGGGLQGTATFYPGTLDQDRDPYLAAQLGANVPAYNGFAHIVFKDFYIGTRTSVPPFYFELQNFPTSFPGSSTIGTLDCNPLAICWDVITQPDGRFNLPAEILDQSSFTSAATRVSSEGLGMSITVGSQMSGQDFLEEIMRHIDGVMYKDPIDAKIRVKLIRQDYNPSSIPAFSKADVIELKSFSKTLWAETFNQCRVTFNERESGYEESVAIAQDFANITYQNRVRTSDASFPGAKVASAANAIAARQLSVMSVPLYKCDLVMKRTAANLRPGDVFKLNYEPYGISEIIMRVVKINLGSLEDGKVTISCVQDKFASDSVVFAPPEGSEFEPISFNAAAVTDARVIELPLFISNIFEESLSTFENSGRVLSLGGRPTGSSFAYSLNSYVGSQRNLEIEQTPYYAVGFIVAPYSKLIGSETGHDNSGLIIGGMTGVEIEQLTNPANFAAASDGSGLFMIGNELLLYSGVTDNEDGTIILNNVYRGVLDTVFEDHSANDRVYFFGDLNGLVESLYPISTNLNFRFQDHTPKDTYPLSSAANVPVTITGRERRPLHPQYLTLEGSRAPSPGVALESVSVAWRRRNRLASTIAAYNGSDAPESGVIARIGWRIDSGSFTYENVDGNSTVIDVTGLAGTLEVRVWAIIESNNRESINYDVLTMELT
ncbi:tail megatron [Enterobacteria phage FtMidnight]